MSVYTAAIQKLYVAYFNRPADFSGLAFWEGVVAKANGSTAAVAAAFAASAEYKATFAGMDEAHVVAQVYQNLFGRAPDLNGLNFWTQALLNKQMTIDNVVTTIAAGAQGADATIIANKVAAATAFTAALDTSAEALGYSGDIANATAKAWLSTVTDDASLKTAIAQAALDAIVTKVTAPHATPMTISLTSGVDTFTGAAGDDVITAVIDATHANPLTAFDAIDAGAGTDTIRFVDTATAAGSQLSPVATGATVANVENVSVVTTGGISLNTKSWTGVTDVTVTAAGTAAASLTVGDATNVTLSSAAAAAAATTVSGGKAVNVALSDAGAGTVSVTGAALTSVSVKGGNGITIDNFGTDAAKTTATGTTLTAVTLEGIAVGSATVSGAALTNVTLKNIAVASNVTVNNATASHALNITANAAGKISADPAVAVTVTVADAAATTVNVAAAGASNLAVSAGKATKVAVTGDKALVLDLTGDSKVATIDASAAAGNVTLKGIAASATSITTGAGADTFTVTANTIKDDANTTVDETVNATVSSGAGNDTVTIATAGNGKVTVDTGAGNDTVNIASHGAAVLNIQLGDGNDTLNATADINATDVIDAGAGTDTLALKLVGSANIGAFSNFDLFDAAGLGKSLDVEILATKNTVSEFVASGDVGAGATLLNVGAGVGVRVTGDMTSAADATVTSNLTVTQKTGGALTVTVDADETGTADTGIDTVNAKVTATNATSLKAVFDTAYLASITGETVAGDNVTSLNLSGAAATTLDIVSGGALSNNSLTYTDTGAKLATVTVSGAQALNLSVTSSTLATVDSSAATGGLSFNTDNLKDGGKVILGSGVDTITVGAKSTISNVAPTNTYESIQGFEKTAAVALSADAADATASAAAWADADTLVLSGAAVADKLDVAGGSLNAKGVLTFTGAGPATLADAVAIADLAADGPNEALVFQYLGDSYVFVQNAGADVIVKLVGTTGITNFAENTTVGDHFILV